MYVQSEQVDYMIRHIRIQTIIILSKVLQKIGNLLLLEERSVSPKHLSIIHHNVC